MASLWYSKARKDQWLLVCSAAKGFKVVSMLMSKYRVLWTVNVYEEKCRAMEDQESWVV